MTDFFDDENKDDIFPPCVLNGCNLESIPGRLKEKNNWVLWKLEKKANQDKLAKIPYQINGMTAKANKPETWSSLSSVLETYKKGGYVGIGYEFKEGDEIVGIDFDHCIVDGKISEDVEKWIEKFNSYTEFSQSGQGIHIIIKGKKTGKTCKKGNIEIYESGRFFALTGNIYKNYGMIRESQKALSELYESTFGKNITKATESSERHIRPKASVNVIDNTKEVPGVPDNEIIDKASNAKNGAKFLSLYNGNFSEYSSQSEADCALCSMIAFYTQDRMQLERIFDKSGLNRDKWRDRKDYRDSTIQKAIEGLTGKFNWGQKMNVLDGLGDNVEVVALAKKSDNELVRLPFIGKAGKKEKSLLLEVSLKDLGIDAPGTTKISVGFGALRACERTAIIVENWIIRKKREEILKIEKQKKEALGMLKEKEGLGDNVEDIEPSNS